MKTIDLPNGMTTIVDDDDYESLSKIKWHFHPSKHGHSGYATHYNGNGKLLWMHRIVNKTPDGMETDHINRNKLDNRKCNLRTVTSSANRQNKIYKNELDLRGVKKDWNAYVARIRIGGVLVTIGRYKTSLEAALAFDKKAREIYGEHAEVNFRDPEEASCCSECGHKLDIVRPGKYQCPRCE